MKQLAKGISKIDINIKKYNKIAKIKKLQSSMTRVQVVFMVFVKLAKRCGHIFRVNNLKSCKEAFLVTILNKISQFFE